MCFFVFQQSPHLRGLGAGTSPSPSRLLGGGRAKKKLADEAAGKLEKWKGQDQRAVDKLQ